MNVDEEIGRRIAAVEVREGDFAEVARRGRSRRAARRSVWGAVAVVAAVAAAGAWLKIPSDGGAAAPSASATPSGTRSAPLSVSTTSGWRPPLGGSGERGGPAAVLDPTSRSVLFAGSDRCGQRSVARVEGTTVTLTFLSVEDTQAVCPLVFRPVTYVIGEGLVDDATTLVVETPTQGGGTDRRAYDLTSSSPSEGCTGMVVTGASTAGRDLSVVLRNDGEVGCDVRGLEIATFLRSRTISDRADAADLPAGDPLSEALLAPGDQVVLRASTDTCQSAGAPLEVSFTDGTAVTLVFPGDRRSCAEPGFGIEVDEVSTVP